jgi:uncharacterized protein with HEPN domain
MTKDHLHHHLENMAEAIISTLQFVQGISRDEFFGDKKTQKAVAMNIIIIGEAATIIYKKHMDFVLQHPQISWDDMRGMRNRIVHAYFAVDWQYVWDTVHKDFPPLIDAITPLITSCIEQDNDSESPGY